MRQLVRFALITTFFGLLATNCPRQTPAGQPFTITINVASHAVKIGSEIRLRITLTNVSGHKVVIGRAKGDARGEEAGYRIEIADEKGQSPPETRYMRVLNGKEQDAFVSSPVAFTLEPGKSYDDAMIVNKFYSISQPGKYKIQVQRTDPASGTSIKSNTITVTITP